MAESSFAGKFLKKIKKVDTEQVEGFLAQILREKAFLEIILDSLTEGVVVAGQGTKVVFINETAKQLLGLTRTECLGKEIAALLKAKSLQEVAEEFYETLEPVRQRTVTVRTPKVRHYAVTVIPIENDDAIMTHSVWIVSDRTEEERRAKEAQQVENMESLAVLTAGVAHEVKNPLNSLNIHAQLLAKGFRELQDRFGHDAKIERLQKSTHVILEEIERLAHVVDDFIHAVRPVRPNFQKTSLNRIVMNLAELFGPDCRERGIELTLTLDPDDPPLLIDADQIHQALLNVVKNAMEAIEGPGGRLNIRTQTKSDHVLVEVEDNGCGIAEDDRLRIFEPYHTTKFSGSGLGLVLVFRIVKAHRGAIGLNSEIGVGTVFSIALPLDERPIRMLPAQVEPPLEGLGE